MSRLSFRGGRRADPASAHPALSTSMRPGPARSTSMCPGPARLGRFLLSRRSGRTAAWVLDRLFPAHGAAARVARALARRSPELACFHATAAGPELGALAAEVEGVLAGLPGGGRAGDWVLAVPGEDDRRGRYTLFFLTSERGGARPRLDRVVKLRRTAPKGDPDVPARRPLAAEADVLEELARTLPEPLRRTVPRVLARHDTAGGWEVLELSALPGRSAYVEQAGAFRREKPASRHLHAAGAWLAAFQRATLRRDAPWEPPAWEELAALPGGPGGPRPEWHRRLVAEAEDHPLPATAGHGDFWARNLLVADGGRGAGSRDEPPAGVVDWEHFRPGAPPFDDLFHFAWTYARGAVGWHRPDRAALDRGFLADGPLAGAIRRYLREHARETGGDAGSLGDQFRVWLLRRGRTDLYRGLEEAGRSVFSG